VSILVHRVTATVRHGTMTHMTDMTGTNGVAGHFGRELRRTRIARGWSIAEVARRTGINAAHLSRIELGQRPPTEKTASALDKVFPEKQRWFSNWHGESQSWPEIPATFRSWPDYEDRSTSLRVWTPGILEGLVQTDDYARALIATEPAIDAATRDNRARGRMERQRRFWDRQPAVMATLVVDLLSLFRQVGNAEIMAAQLRRLLDIAAMPTVTLQVMPAIEHPANNSGFMIADSSAWCEHAAAGYVFTEPETVRRLALRFDTLRAESYRASESVALIRRLADTWATGVSPLTATLAAANASK
jgi:transcriptional regulator with XRE-family HTH domain